MKEILRIENWSEASSVLWHGYFLGLLTYMAEILGKSKTFVEFTTMKLSR